MSIAKRYDFVLFFDVQDGNPNGDPDAGNLPRVDAETGAGLVTDVCLKRKVRNYVQLTQLENGQPRERFNIYIKEKAVLGRSHVDAFNDLKITLGEECRAEIDHALLGFFEEWSLPDGFAIDDGDNGKKYLVIAADVDKKAVKAYLKDTKPDKALKIFIEKILKDSKSRKPQAEEVEKGRDWMCSKFFDVRTFGAVMSLKSAPNCGQVRGPVQLTFARSVDPVVALEHSITRMAVATEAEAEKQSGDNRTMGRKFTVPYGLYRAHGFVSAHLAAQTGFSEDDLTLFWESLQRMFDHDHSAARGLMTTRALIVFEHGSALGTQNAATLFERVDTKRVTEGPARKFADYQILLDSVPVNGISVVVKI